MYGRKRYIDEKYADAIMQLAAQYRNTHCPQDSLSFAMDRALETMDSYVAYINNMGYTMYEISIAAMADYIWQITDCPGGFSKEYLQEIRAYLESLL